MNLSEADKTTANTVSATVLYMTVGVSTLIGINQMTQSKLANIFSGKRSGEHASVENSYISYKFTHLPFYDLRQEGTDEMLKEKNTQAPALLLALREYRAQGHFLRERRPGPEDYEHVERFIEWCSKHNLHNAEDAALQILEKSKRENAEWEKERMMVPHEVRRVAI